MHSFFTIFLLLTMLILIFTFASIVTFWFIIILLFVQVWLIILFFILIEDDPTKSQEYKQKANQLYKQKQYSEAIQQYQKALSYTSQESEQRKKFKSVLQSNMGLCLMKMQEDESAIKYLQSALKLNPEYSKARTNLAITYEKIDKIQEALDQYKKLYEANPDDKFVKGKVTVLEVKVNELNEKRKQQVMSGLKNIGNSVLGYFGMSLDNFKLQQGSGGGYNVAYKP